MIIKRYQVIVDEVNAKSAILINKNDYKLNKSELLNKDFIYTVNIKDKEVIIRDKNSMKIVLILKNADKYFLYYVVKSCGLTIWYGKKFPDQIDFEIYASLE